MSENLEAVAWAQPEDLIQDGYSHSFGVSSEECAGRVPLCEMPKAQTIIDDLENKIKQLKLLLNKNYGPIDDEGSALARRAVDKDSW